MTARRANLDTAAHQEKSRKLKWNATPMGTTKACSPGARGVYVHALHGLLRGSDAGAWRTVYVASVNEVMHPQMYDVCENGSMTNLWVLRRTTAVLGSQVHACKQYMRVHACTTMT